MADLLMLEMVLKEHRGVHCLWDLKGVGSGETKGEADQSVELLSLLPRSDSIEKDERQLLPTAHLVREHSHCTSLSVRVVVTVLSALVCRCERLWEPVY